MVRMKLVKLRFQMVFERVRKDVALETEASEGWEKVELVEASTPQKGLPELTQLSLQP